MNPQEEEMNLQEEKVNPEEEKMNLQEEKGTLGPGLPHVLKFHDFGQTVATILSWSDPTGSDQLKIVATKMGQSLLGAHYSGFLLSQCQP